MLFYFTKPITSQAHPVVSIGAIVPNAPASEARRRNRVAGSLNCGVRQLVGQWCKEGSS
jgi:hypothetical protein